MFAVSEAALHKAEPGDNCLALDYWKAKRGSIHNVGQDFLCAACNAQFDKVVLHMEYGVSIRIHKKDLEVWKLLLNTTVLGQSNNLEVEISTWHRGLLKRCIVERQQASRIWLNTDKLLVLFEQCLLINLWCVLLLLLWNLGLLELEWLLRSVRSLLLLLVGLHCELVLEHLLLELGNPLGEKVSELEN